MTGIRLTAAQARKMGIVAGTSDVGKKPRGTRHHLPRDRASSTCHTCGETFTTDAAETRHVNDTHHPRYLSSFEVVS